MACAQSPRGSCTSTCLAPGLAYGAHHGDPFFDDGCVQPLVFRGEEGACAYGYLLPWAALCPCFAFTRGTANVGGSLAENPSMVAVGGPATGWLVMVSAGARIRRHCRTIDCFVNLDRPY